MIRVLLVDDQALVRTGFRMILENADDMEVVGEAGDGAEAAAMAVDLRPHVVLMDTRMPGVDGVEATRRICTGDSETRALVLTTFDLDEYAYAALRAGTSGFLLKDTLAPDLLSAIRVVTRGDAVVAPSVTRRLLERHVGTGPEPITTSANLDILTANAKCWGSSPAACRTSRSPGRLFLTEGIVKTHVSRVLSKLGLRDRVQAVVHAYECGLVRAGSTKRP